MTAHVMLLPLSIVMQTYQSVYSFHLVSFTAITSERLSPVLSLGTSIMFVNIYKFHQ